MMIALIALLSGGCGYSRQYAYYILTKARMSSRDKVLHIKTSHLKVWMHFYMSPDDLNTLVNDIRDDADKPGAESNCPENPPMWWQPNQPGFKSYSFWQIQGRSGPYWPDPAYGNWGKTLYINEEKAEVYGCAEGMIKLTW